MKIHTNISLLALMGVGLVLGGTGCVTPALWKKENRIGSYRPSPQPNVALFHSEQRADMLVLYNERINNSKRYTRRAYYLFENKDTIGKVSRPRFVSLNETNGLPEIPILPKDSVPENYPRDFFAVISEDADKLTLYYNGGCAKTYSLDLKFVHFKR